LNTGKKLLASNAEFLAKKHRIGNRACRYNLVANNYTLLLILAKTSSGKIIYAGKENGNK
jgi:hypothetical protein